jgi:predicted transcriptional regulator
MAEDGVISGNFPYTRPPLATSANTLLTVSSIRVELALSFRAARIAVAAKRKRFWIFSPAWYTSSDRMIASIPGDGAFETEAGLASAETGGMISISLC